MQRAGRSLVILGCFALSILAFAQDKYEILQGTRKVGSARVTSTLQKDGSLKLLFAMTLTGPGGSVTVREEFYRDKNANPTRAFTEVIGVNGKIENRIIVSFNSAGADVVIETGGKRDKQQVTLAKNAPRQNFTDFWFLRDQPKVGQECIYYNFNSSGLKWELEKSTYKGLVTLNHRGKNIQVHSVVSTNSKSWLDSKGSLVRAEQSGIVIVRTS